ncbi:MAG: Maf family nucleotide pyrophosphatase [Paramuribaculum sp.]|nr:Maf family nucleotide pyrophosphatase [Paramuribaculum sp.]
MAPVNPLSHLQKYRIILASASPRRKELLSMLGLRFEVMPAPVDNEEYPIETPIEYIPEYLARKKAEACDFGDDTLVITADTVVVADNKVLGKPKDHTEALEMLSTLSGSTHRVITGVAIKTPHTVMSFSSITEVAFARLTDNEKEWYISTYRPFDKAGAYGIQEWIGCIGVTGITGSYYNVMGLPLHRLYTLLTHLSL